MHLKTLRLRNFRNFANLEVTFHHHLNVIVGDNAQGKTNLLEAIFLLSTGRSFRTPHLSDLISYNKKFFIVEAEFFKDNVDQYLLLYFDGKTKKLKYNSSLFPSFYPLLGLLPAVLHSTLDTQLLLSPSYRRRFLNFHLAQETPLYVHHLARFLQALKQRNCLLKTKNLTTIDSFEQEMAKSAAFLTQQRKELIDDLKNIAIKYTQIISNKKEIVDIKYLTSLYDENGYLKKLQENRQKELRLGYTMLGPHKDDFQLYLENKAAKFFASEGQKRTISMALRFAEWERLKKKTEDAFMQIDDLQMNLDYNRSSLVKTALNGFSQVFITTPSDKDPIDNGKLIVINNGCVSS
jgi:DNA replication and repair protein RecF